MRIISRKALREFWEQHADCKEQLQSWFREVEKGTWLNPNELKIDYPSASLLEDSRVVFNIKGNNYRLIVKINYKYQILWIRFIGTQAEYNKIDVNTI